MKIEKTVLEGRHVRLEPLADHHLGDMAGVVEDGRLWALPFTFVPPPSELPQWRTAAEAQFDAGRELTFATLDRASGTLVGCTRFRNIEAAHRRVEIGSTFIAQSWQRTPINTEAKWLMLRHAFETWRVHRVEFLTDLRNVRSRAAIARIGAKEEGVLRSHTVMRDGYVRDTVVFSVIAAEWPQVKAGLEARLTRP